MSRSILSLVLLVLASIPLAAQQSGEWTLYVAGNEVRDIVDVDGITWFATNRGLVRFERATGAKTFFEKGSSGLPDQPVNSVSNDSAGGIWVSYGERYDRSGFARFDGSEWTFHPSGVVTGTGFGLAWDVAAAGDGTIWAMLYNGHLAHLDDGVWTPVAAGQLDPLGVQLAFDADGRLWEAVKYLGVARLAGDTWTTFTKENSALPNHHVLAIEPDVAGGMWVATSDGLAHVADTGSSVYDITGTGLQPNWITGIAHDENGTLWVSNHFDLFRFDGTALQRVETPEPLGWITTIARASGGGIWIGTSTGARHFDGATLATVGTASTPIAIDHVSSLVVDRDGVLWGAIGADIVRFDGTTWSVIDTSEHRIPHFSIADALVDRRGRIWFATAQRGVSMNDGGAWHHWEGAPLRVQDGGVAIAEDRDGTIWVAGHEVYSFDGATWTRHERFPAFSDSVAYTVAIDSAGGLWVGTYAAGIHQYANGVWTVHRPFESWPTDLVVGHDGTVHVGYNGALTSFDGNAWTALRESDGTLPRGDVERILPMADGSMWVGFSGWSGDGHGVGHLASGRWTFHGRNGGPLPDGNVKALAAAPDGSIWVGTRAGLARYRNATSDVGGAGISSTSTSTIDALQPNPAHDAMRIGFTLASASRATLEMFDALGRRVAVVASGRFDAGAHSVDARVAGLAPGAYHCRLVTDDGTSTRLVIVR